MAHYSRETCGISHFVQVPAVLDYDRLEKIHITASTGGRRLIRRIVQFRYLGYVMLGIGLVCAEFSLPGYWWGILLISLAWPLCLHAALRVCVANPQGLRGLQFFENLSASACAALLQFPAAQVNALLVSLLSGNLAQGGLKRLPEALLALVPGWMLGDWCRVQLGLEPWFAATHLSDLIGYGHILLFTSLISAAAYQRSMEMHQASRHLSEESRKLRVFSERITRYVDPGLSQRLRTNSHAQMPRQRIWVSVCFVDLVEFTHMTSRLAPEAVCETLNLFLGRVSALATGLGGRMDKFLGDGVMITFGDSGDSVEGERVSVRQSRRQVADAMLAFAARFPALMNELNQELDRLALPVTLRVRMGGASGHCTVGDFGEGERLDYTIIGPAVNLASRLEALAPVGSMLIDEATHKLANDETSRSDSGRREIRGFAEPVSLWQVAAERSAQQSTAPPEVLSA